MRVPDTEMQAKIDELNPQLAPLVGGVIYFSELVLAE